MRVSVRLEPLSILLGEYADGTTNEHASHHQRTRNQQIEQNCHRTNHMMTRALLMATEKPMKNHVMASVSRASMAQNQKQTPDHHPSK